MSVDVIYSTTNSTFGGHRQSSGRVRSAAANTQEIVLPGRALRFGVAGLDQLRLATVGRCSAPVAASNRGLLSDNPLL